MKSNITLVRATISRIGPFQKSESEKFLVGNGTRVDATLYREWKQLIKSRN